MENVVSRGVTGSKAKFIIDLGKHSLSFTTKLQDSIDPVEANLPSEASIDLPNVHITAEYIQVNTGGFPTCTVSTSTNSTSTNFRYV